MILVDPIRRGGGNVNTMDRRRRLGRDTQNDHGNLTSLTETIKGLLNSRLDTLTLHPFLNLRANVRITIIEHSISAQPTEERKIMWGRRRDDEVVWVREFGEGHGEEAHGC